MKNAYSPIDRLASELARPKGTGAEFMTELSKKPGYKQAEVEDRDLQTLMALPKMAREEFLAALKAKGAVVPRERILSGEAFPEGLSRAEMMEREASGVDQDAAHHEEYTLPGGSNYREILLKHPKGGFRGVSGHFGEEPDILASIRVKDRIGPNGEKILHLEEIQSDWHQSGREKGYMPKGVDPEQEVKKAGAAYGQLYTKWAEAKSASVAAEAALKSDRPLYQDPEVRARYTEALREHNNRIMDLTPQLMKADEARRKATEMSNYGIPDAPYKKNWHELALKRMIQHAAEKGYDSIAVTPGEEQAKRYKLSQHVGTVSYNPDEKHFQAFKPNRETLINEKDASPERVAELIGKDAATRLMAAPKQMGHHSLEGENLDVGGEGMKGFYDRMVPKFLNQFGKKYGAQVQPGAVSIVSTPAQHHGLTEDQYQAMSPEYRASLQRGHAYALEGAKTSVPVHSFPITPEMREDVTKNGIPLYAKGGEVEVRSTVKDEAIQRKIPEMEAAAKALQAGIIDRKEYDRTIKKHKPVKPYDFVPQPASDEDADRALMINKKPHWRGHSHWPAGRKVGLRLDIPAYETHGVWVNSIHDEEGREDDKFKTSYAPVSSVKNATFDASPEKAVKVATGEQNKSPFARIKGELHHMTEDEAVEHMKEHLNDPEYAQVGMDPRRHGYFYDRKTMKPVTHSEHVVQIGPLVLAKNPKYGKREAYADGGRVGVPDDNYFSVLEEKNMSNPRYRAYLERQQGLEGVYPETFAAPLARGLGSMAKTVKGMFTPTKTGPQNAVGPFPLQHPKAILQNPIGAPVPDITPAQIAEILKGARTPQQIANQANRRLPGKLKDAALRDTPKQLFLNANDLSEVVRVHQENKAKGGAVKPAVRGIIKERVTVSPDKDVMMYELMSAKHFTKKVK